ncbi:hypothetical protein OK015_23660 [Mycobacterium sp. Aquia_216]|uniref:hypothetical protein n=1 Tax=Mycobacterium sp. Aquia_216 TaxID=2991729 RepID=UPI00227BE702|nr:hypothetical protein [Mycobacterium sp. Aquia_216]WAJ44115.1 hypothetical protein OK015_23660 [Mycobacterium sp. Aquia_216]
MDTLHHKVAVITGSASGIGRMPYAATKAAIVQTSEGLAIYLRPKNIGVTLLRPGRC